MCYNCYEEEGKPKPTEASSKAVPLIEKVYSDNFSGGNLHVQLDDMNLWDDFFSDDYIKPWSEDCPITEAEQACYQYMKALTKEERFAAVAEFEGWV